jgi:hypothetical protein
MQETVAAAGGVINVGVDDPGISNLPWSGSSVSTPDQSRRANVR